MYTLLKGKNKIYSETIAIRKKRTHMRPGLNPKYKEKWGSQERGQTDIGRWKIIKRRHHVGGFLLNRLKRILAEDRPV